MLQPLFLQHAAEAGHPTIEEPFLWAIIAAPLVAWGLIVVYARKIPQLSGYLAILGIGVSTVIAYVALFNVIDADGGVAQYTHEWFEAGSLGVNLGVRIDGLTAVMLVVVT